MSTASLAYGRGDRRRSEARSGDVPGEFGKALRSKRRPERMNHVFGGPLAVAILG